MLQQKESTLTYFLAEKNRILVISLIGPLAKVNTPTLENCIREVKERSPQWVILNFRDVPPEVDKTVVPQIARLQKLVREKPAILRLSSIHPELKKFLEYEGLVRSDEVCNNLAEALKSLPLEKVA